MDVVTHELLSAIETFKEALDDWAAHLQATYLPHEPECPSPDMDEDDDEAWRLVLLSEIFAGLGKCINHCHDDEKQTLGELTDWLKSGKCLTDIPGIGPAKAKQMELALESFWSRHLDAAGVLPPVAT